MGRHQILQSLVEHMGIYLGCADVRVAQHLLQAAQIGAVGEQVTGK